MASAGFNLLGDLFSTNIGVLTAWCVGIAQDVLYYRLGGICLASTIVVFLVLTLQQRLKVFPLWQQSFALLVIYGLAQLVLKLSTLSVSAPCNQLLCLASAEAAYCGLGCMCCWLTSSVFVVFADGTAEGDV